MNEPRDIIDRIDDLVDRQLQQERSGYDNNINQDKCWHCGRPWHGLPITKRIAAMAAQRTYDENYRIADDDTPILCHGSEFIGPMQSRAPTIESVTISSLADRAIEYANATVGRLVATVCGFGDVIDTDAIPTSVQLWDRNWNAQQTVHVTDWEWTPDRSQARFIIDCGAEPYDTARMLQMMVTTEEPRRVWRIHQITTYTTHNRQLVEIANVQTELDEIRRHLPNPTPEELL